MAKRDRRLYLRGDTWWARIKVENKTKRVSTGCKNYEAASLRADELEKRQADPVRYAAAKASFQEAADRFIAKVKQAGKATGTLHMYQTKAGHLVRLFSNCSLAEINASKVEEYVKKRAEEGACPNTISKDLTTLRRILKLAKHVGEFPADIKALMPFDFAPKYKPRVRFLSDYEELQKLLLELPPIRAAHVCYMLATGARWSESVRAERTDINVEPGIILVRGTKTDGSWRQVPILDIFKPALDLVLQVVPEGKAGPMFPPWTSAGHALPNACGRADLAAITPNDVRRTAASWLRQAGVEPSLIAVFLGHTDSRMVETVYGKLPAQRLGEAIANRLGQGNGKPSEPREAQGAQGGETSEKRPETRPDLCARFVPREPLRVGHKPLEGRERLRNMRKNRLESSAQGRNRTADTGIFNPDANGGQPSGSSQGNERDARKTVPGSYTIVRPVKPRTKPKK